MLNKSAVNMHFAQCIYLILPHMGNKCLLVFVAAVSTVNRGLSPRVKTICKFCCFLFFLLQTSKGAWWPNSLPPYRPLLLPPFPSAPPSVTVSD